MYKKIILILIIVSLIILTMLPMGFCKEDNSYITGMVYPIGWIKTEKPHITEITIYNPHILDKDLDKAYPLDNVTIYEYNPFYLAVNLFMNNNSQGFRHLNYEVISSDGTILKKGKCLTTPRYAFQNHNRKPICYEWVGINGLKAGDYDIKFTYNGNHDQNWPPTTKTIKIHVIPS